MGGHAAVTIAVDLETLEVLRELVEEVRGLRLDLARNDLSCHTDADVAFLMAIAGSSVGGSVFSAADLWQHAAVVDDALGHALAGQSVVQIGRRLRALAGRALGGLQVQRVKRDAAGIVWCVVVASDLHAKAGAGGSDGAR
jgi:hypothetical protein